MLSFLEQSNKEFNAFKLSALSDLVELIKKYEYQSGFYLKIRKDGHLLSKDELKALSLNPTLKISHEFLNMLDGDPSKEKIDAAQRTIDFAMRRKSAFERINKNKRVLGKSIYEGGKLVARINKEFCCKNVEKYIGKRFDASDEIPIFPLIGCDTEMCHCYLMMQTKQQLQSLDDENNKKGGN